MNEGNKACDGRNVEIETCNRCDLTQKTGYFRSKNLSDNINLKKIHVVYIAEHTGKTKTQKQQTHIF